MGAYKFVITIESDTPPPLILGSGLAGGTVTELRMEKQGLVTAAWLANKYSLSVETIRNRLAHINRGGTGKALYDPFAAHEALQLVEKSKPGAKRKN